MSSLPLEIIEIILSGLPIKFLMRCSCVCKSWLALTRDPDFINLHYLNQSSLQNPSLILNTTICTDATDFRSQLYSADSQHLSCTEIPFSQHNLDEFRVVGSCNGLLCLVHRTNKYFCVCNPFTGDRIKIPQLRTRVEQKYCTEVVVGGFGFSPKTNEYKVVQFIYGRGHLMPYDDVEKKISAAYVYNLGGGCWRYAGTAPFKISDDSKLRAFVDGVLHWTIESKLNTIHCFDVAHEVFVDIPSPAIGLPAGDHSLVVLSGFLAVIEYSAENCIVIWIMKDHNVISSWTRNFTICFNPVGRNFRYFQVLYVQKDGKILMVYNNQALLSYNPHTMILRKLSIVGLPSWFEAVCHVESLVWPFKNQSKIKGL